MDMKRAGLKNGHDSPVQKEFAQVAEKYDDKWSFYVKATLQETLNRIEVYSGQRVLDIGCGTGILLETLEKKNPGIILAGVDPTQEMLDIAGRRLSKKVHLERSWAEKLPFEAETFDIIISCNTFHYIREPIVALKEAMRILKPAGKLVITDWCADYITCRICELFLLIFNEAHFKTYRKRECYNLLCSSGFNDIKIDRYRINWLWGMMTATAIKSMASAFISLSQLWVAL